MSIKSDIVAKIQAGTLTVEPDGWANYLTVGTASDTACSAIVRAHVNTYRVLDEEAIDEVSVWTSWHLERVVILVRFDQACRDVQRSINGARITAGSAPALGLWASMYGNVATALARAARVE